MKPLTFTPFANGFENVIDEMGRFHMRLNQQDFAKIGRGHPWKAVVTDQNTGKMYQVQGASCGTPHCFCAAKITAVL